MKIEYKAVVKDIEIDTIVVDDNHMGKFYNAMADYIGEEISVIKYLNKRNWFKGYCDKDIYIFHRTWLENPAKNPEIKHMEFVLDRKNPENVMDFIKRVNNRIELLKGE